MIEQNVARVNFVLCVLSDFLLKIYWALVLSRFSTYILILKQDLRRCYAITIASVFSKLVNYNEVHAKIFKKRSISFRNYLKRIETVRMVVEN